MSREATDREIPPFSWLGLRERSVVFHYDIHGSCRTKGLDMTLQEWQIKRLNELRVQIFRPSGYCDQVTVVAYTFPENVNGNMFDLLECAILQTWFALGKLKTVLVANCHFPKLDYFASKHDGVEVQIEPSLEPGNVDSMSADCCARLHSRFSTPYCLIIQDDGFPLKDNLGYFIGKYDFVGAPYVRISWWRNMICAGLGYWMSNGGFSLRSKRICEAAAEYWKRKYAIRHPSNLTVDDLFYTQTLPLRHPSYRFKFRIAPNKIAIHFSYDAIVRQPVETMPMGFHRSVSFEELAKKGYLQ